MATLKPRTLEQLLAASWPPDDWRDVTVIVAVSGGPDSVALLRAMAKLKRESGGTGRLIIAHLNHHLRPEADDDARFVADLAKQLDLPLEQGDAAVAELATRQGDGIEAAAREARYNFFQQAAHKHGARYVATAHTADDQIETVLLNVLRGTGLAGLAGMQRARALGPAVSLIRPLLRMRREEVLKYLDEIGQRYCLDSSNTSHDFTRNRLRHELLPLLRENYNPEIDSALARLSQLAGAAQRFMERLAEDLLERCASSELPAAGLNRRSADRTVCLDTGPLKDVDRHLAREMFVALWRRMGWPLQSMGFSEWDFLAETALRSGKNLSGEAPAKRILPGQIAVERRGDELQLTNQAR
jgi:tRNA(Ile)-lysidine synthase